MNAANRNRLREGQVVSGVLETNPPPPNASQPAERDAYDGVEGVFAYSTGEQLMAEMDDATPADSRQTDAATDATPPTAKRRLSLWERMLEALDIEFSRPDPRLTARPLALARAGEIENPTDLNRGTQQDPETDGENAGDMSSNTNRQPDGGINGYPRPEIHGLRATLGELVGVDKQSRDAR